MELIVNNHIITGDIVNILKKLKVDANKPYLFHNINFARDNIRITCPNHKNGLEEHPSCSIYIDRKNPAVEYGLTHCFTCDYTVRLPELVRDCLETSLENANQWLVDNFSDILIDNIDIPDKIEIKSNYKLTNNKKLVDLNPSYHPYLASRHITKDTADNFGLYFDEKSQCIVFPVWDEHNNLVMLTKRSIIGKQFYIEENKDKPVYLLNFLISNRSTTAYIAESQINALTLQQWGYPGVAMLGGGNKKQYDILRHSGIRNYVLCFDGDEAGDKDIARFMRYMPKDILVSAKQMPRDGRDVNDLTKEEFDNLPTIIL